MKSLLFVFITAGFALLSGCNSSSKSPNNPPAIAKHLKYGKHCYKALFEKDSASLTFTFTQTNQVTGELYINYYNKDTVSIQRQPTMGEFTGEFKGDTLFADYSFTSGANGKDKYINPIALLYKNDTLIMGSGKIYSYLGRTYFDDKTPINFEKSRFRFTLSDCK